MSTDDLDSLLSRPLAEPTDNGFSARILARIAQGSERHARLEGIAYGITAAVVVAALPFTQLGDVVSKLTPQIVSSEPLWFAVAALVLTGSFLRWTWSR